MQRELKPHSEERHAENFDANIDAWRSSAQRTHDPERLRRLLSVLATHGDVEPFPGWDQGLAPRFVLTAEGSEPLSESKKDDDPFAVLIEGNEPYTAEVTLQRVVKLYRIVPKHTKYWGLGWIDDDLAAQLTGYILARYSDMGHFTKHGDMEKTCTDWIASAFRSYARSEDLGRASVEDGSIKLTVPISNSVCRALTIRFDPPTSSEQRDARVHVHQPTDSRLQKVKDELAKDEGMNRSQQSGSTTAGGSFVPSPKMNPDIEWTMTEEEFKVDVLGPACPLIYDVSYPASIDDGDLDSDEVHD